MIEDGVIGYHAKLLFSIRGMLVCGPFPIFWEGWIIIDKFFDEVNFLFVTFIEWNPAFV